MINKNKTVRWTKSRVTVRWTVMGVQILVVVLVGNFELDFVNSKYSANVRYSVYGLMTLKSHDLDFLPK